MGLRRKSIDDGLAAPYDTLSAFGVYTSSHAIADMDAQAGNLLQEREFTDNYRARDVTDTSPSTFRAGSNPLRINPGRHYRERGPKIR